MGIRDSINTINAQAAQRYIARVSLDANVPGNGFGGSTQRVKVASPAASEDAAAGNGLIPTACGGGLYYQAFYVSLAPSQYSLPLTSTTAETLRLQLHP